MTFSEGILSVYAKQASTKSEASAAVPVEVVEEIATSSDEGIPEPELVDQAGAKWRSRVLEERWQVNTGHPDYRANSSRPALKLRYLAMLFGGFGLAIQGTLVVFYIMGVLPNILERPGWLLLSVLMDVTGLQCLGFGVMSELLGRTYFASRRKPIYSIRSILRASERDLPRRAATP